MFNNVLIVCIGNICRSPLAENMLAKTLPNIQVDSAGLGALVGYSADETMQKVARCYYALDLSAHRAKQVTPTLLEAADLTFVMDVKQLQYLHQQYPHLRGRILLLSHFSPLALQGKEVADPYQQSEAVFVACAREIALHVNAIGKALCSCAGSSL